jgi:uncharacterized surface protein with fasciclin (FAS1) repeats
MRSSRLAALAALPVLAFSAAACGDDEEDGAGTAATPAATATPEAAATAEAAEQDIVALAQGTPELSTLVDAVTAADLGATLQEDGPYTVFAPTNDAFTAVGQDTLDQLLAPAGKDQLTSVLTYHVVPGETLAADLQDGQRLETVQGEQLRVRIRGDEVQVGDATVTQPDVDAANGVVHVIDGVLLPPEA